MKFTKTLILLILPFIFYSCGNGKDLNKNFDIVTNLKKSTIQNGNEVTISLKAKKNIEVDSVAYFIDDKYLGSAVNLTPLKTAINQQKLGKKDLKATIYSGENKADITGSITVVSNKAPQLYTYEIVNTYPHDAGSYTQGLEFHDGILYESAGQLKESSLRKTDLTTGKVLEEIKIDDQYFAEGLTILNNKIFQLTWQSKIGFIYDLETFKQTGTFAFGESKEGWGLCNDGNTIYKSDGTDKIWLLNPENLTETSYIEVADNKAVRPKFNELEWVNGKIYANTYQYDSISIINPESGAIEGLIDLRSLKKEITSIKDTANEVLNGIAYNKDTNKLYVTGKHWDKLFEIRIIKK
ncbi:MAG: glutaminyl-peptide cyclotransferase [Leeuwenhoekiella sp.]